MLLGFFTILIMLAVGYAYLREGLLTAFTMSCNVLLSGVIAFNFFEPLASMFEGPLSGMFLQGYEDFFSLIILFCISLGLLRTICNVLSPSVMNFPLAVQRPGGFLVGLLAGYLVSGFLVCALQTLPWHENFMGFDYSSSPDGGARKILPPDRVWLAMMSRAGAYTFANEEDERGKESGTTPYDRYKTFDRDATFEIRYGRYRRYDDKFQTQSYGGEFDQEVHRR